MGATAMRISIIRRPSSTTIRAEPIRLGKRLYTLLTGLIARRKKTWRKKDKTEVSLRANTSVLLSVLPG